MASRITVLFAVLALAITSGLAAAGNPIEVTDVAEGGVNTFVHKLPGRTRHPNLVLKRGLVGPDLWSWFREISEGSVTRKTVAVELMDPAGASASARWVFDAAFPCKWNGPDLRGGQSSVAVEGVELCHHGFQMEE